MINVKTNFTNIYKALEVEEKGEMWQYISQRLKGFVKELMQKGIDVHGKRYKPYSAQYRTFRSKEGLSTNVNLQLTSKMFLRITARNSTQTFKVFIVGAKENRKAEWVTEHREFLAWAKKTEEELQKGINEYLKIKGWL